MAAEFSEFERRYILQTSDLPDSNDQECVTSSAVPPLVSCGSYVEALRNPECQELLEGCKQTLDLEHQLFTTISASLENKDESAKDDKTQHHLVLCTGIAALQLFVQRNFTGPILVPDFFDVFPELVQENLEEACKANMISIAEDTEGVYPLLANTEYLVLAKVVFCRLKSELSSCNTIDWWALRYNMVLQTIAEETSSAIYDRTLKSISAMEDSSFILQNRHLQAQFYLESGQAFLIFSDVASAAKQFTKAESALKLRSTLSGAMGKRTRYQVDPKAQLLLKVEFDHMTILEGEIEGPKLLPKDLPKDVLLNDDTRLPHIKFEEQDDDKVPSLTPVEQLALLTKVQHKRRSCAADLQLKEETKAYLNALLQYPKCWVIQYSALRLRSLLESEECRAVDRALQQLEELVECVKREDPSRYERLKLFYCSSLPASWTTKQEYGKLLVQMGCTKTALGIFEALQLWEDVIDCYNRIGMRQRSALILQELLEKEQTPKLWCLLGDATDNIEHYHKAWEVSKERSSRAQRSLGDYYFHRKSYSTAIEHYQVSVKINHLQVGVWQNIAYAALQLDDWSMSCSAYKKCTVLDPDFFEFWNNLAKAYVQLKEMEKAFSCLEEAIRCKSDSWKMFENMMTVATSIGRFGKALYAYNRLLELKPRHVNLLVISGLVGALLDEESSAELGEFFYKKLVNFLSQLCQCCPAESDLWYYYGEAVSHNPSPTVESRDLACQHFRKSLATATRSSAWAKSPQEIVKALSKLLRMERSLTVSVEGVAPQTALTNVRSVAMMAETVMILSRKGLTNVATGEVVPFAVDALKEAEEAQARIKELINTLVQACS